jgi:hypothetical protein
MSEQEQAQRAPTEEELRAAYEAELKRLRVDDIVVQTIVSLLNLGGRRAGLVAGAEDEKDLAQVRLAIEGVRALLPLVEAELGPDAGRLRDALSQLQITYARQGEAPGGGAPSGQPPEGEPAGEERPKGPGPAQQSGRLWVPGS